MRQVLQSATVQRSTIIGDFHYGHVFLYFHVLITADYYSFLKRRSGMGEYIFFIIIYLFIFAENSIGLVSLWMSELSLALACAVGYLDLRLFLPLVGRVMNMMH